MKQINKNTIVNLSIQTSIYLSMSLLLISCGFLGGNSQPDIDTISDQTLYVGEEKQVEFNIIDDDANDKHAIKATSDNTNVAIVTVKSTSLITILGTAPGTATITLLVRDNSQEDNAESMPMVFEVAVSKPSPTVAEELTLEAHFLVSISEIMYAAEERFTPPQWIELHNDSTQTINLNGWTVTIQNQNTPDLTKPENVNVEFTFQDDFWGDAPLLLPNETVLIVTNEAYGRGNTTDLSENQVYDLRWRTDLPFGLWDTMLSVEAFSIKLVDNRGILIDEAGNYNGNSRQWQFNLEYRGMTRDGNRCSVLRQYINGVALDGTQKNSWIPAVIANLNQNQLTYYGDDNDIGSPGIPPDRYQ